VTLVGARASDELGRVQLVTAAVFLANNIEQPDDCALTELRDANSNSRQAEVLGEWDVVKSGHGDVLWDAQSGTSQRPKSTDGHIVVRREDTIEPLTIVEKRLDCCRTRLLGEVTRHTLTANAMLRTGLLEGIGTFLRVHVPVRSSNVDKVLAPKLNQVLDERQLQRVGQIHRVKMPDGPRLYVTFVADEEHRARQVVRKVAQRRFAAPNSCFNGLVRHACTFAASTFFATRALKFCQLTMNL
jgi:hypothetical protein